MLDTFEIAAKKVENPLAIVEVSGGVFHAKDGKGIGDLVDVKTIETWARDYINNRTDKAAIDEEKHLAAFQFGVRTEGHFAGQSFIEAEPEIRSEWSSEKGRLPWDVVRDAVWSGFDRARDRTL
jgi:hypothetical protein